MKAFIIFFLIGYTAIYPQWKKEKIMDISESENIHDISKNNFAILSSDKGVKRDYYLLNTDNTASKEFIFSTENYEKDYVKFSPNDQFIIIQSKEKNRRIIIIYNLLNKELFKITKPDGDVVSASIIAKDKILYQFRKTNDLPQIYLLNNTTNIEKAVTIGIGEEWVPDGEYFFVKKN